MYLKVFVFCAFCASFISAQKDPLFKDDRNTIVHLLEWKWGDIAKECEDFLSKKKYGGVQISPPSENLIMQGRPWYERYQPVSFDFTTRSGNVTELQDMVHRCNKVGIRIYVDVLLNDMAGVEGRGTANNFAFPGNKSYPAVPFTVADFHPTCEPIDYSNATSIRVCELAGLKDLNQTLPGVRNKFVEYLNKLIKFGVAGFRVDAAKHIWPNDLKYIVENLNNLNESYFPKTTKAYIYQEVSDTAPDAVNNTEYTGFGRVIEFKAGLHLGPVFQKLQNNTSLSSLKNWGTDWGLFDGNDTLVMIDNHDTQRSGGEEVLTYKKPKLYRAATAFMLAHNYSGNTRIISSFNFTLNEDGPPCYRNPKDDIISPVFRKDGESCENGWVCEHRWNAMSNMVEFRSVVEGTNVTNWWSDGKNQIAFSRGNKGFVAFNVDGDMDIELQTGLPKGLYCDIISGKVVSNKCTEKYIEVNETGFAKIKILRNDTEAVFATHINAVARGVNVSVGLINVFFLILGLVVKLFV